MPSIAWFHCGADPFRSGELRLLGLPALMVEEAGWSCSFQAVDAPADSTDLAVIPATALQAIARTGAWTRPPALILSLDDAAITRDPEQLDAARLAAGRLSAVVSRGPIAARWARANLADRVRTLTISDIAEREAELRAAAIRFGVPRPALPDTAPPCDSFWFAAPGDLVDEQEVSLVVEAARAAEEAGRHLVLVAAQATLDWLHQAGLAPSAQAIPWSVGLIGALIASGAKPVLPETRGARRRHAKLARHGAAVPADMDVLRYEPWAVAARWRRLLAEHLPRPRAPAARPRAQRTLLLFLDLIQDVELALPVIRAALARPGLAPRVVVTGWLAQAHGSLLPTLDALGLRPELVDRKAVMAGDAVELDGVDALLTVVETTLNAHKRAHVVTVEAQARGIPTFTMQHGLENVGLTYVDEVHDASVDIRSDHIFAWFPPEHVPALVPERVRPRLIHVGRPRVASPHPPAIPTQPGTRVLAVFENLHWDRYSRRFRDLFMADCFRLADALEDAVLVVKPHPAGKWLLKSRESLERWPVNLMVADPADPLWEGTTASGLIAAADAVITTPSSVAVDAVIAGKRVAVAGYDLDVHAYAPLPILRRFDDWLGFATSRDTGIRAAQARARFLARIDMPGPSEERLVEAIQAAIAGRLPKPPASDSGPEASGASA